MKPTKSIFILFSLFLMFSCDDDTQTNEDTEDTEDTIETPPIEDMISLDWILLMNGRVGDISYVESCDGYVECSYYEFYNENNDTYYTQCIDDEYERWNCRCYDGWDNECGGCRLTIPNYFSVNSCDGYELCNMVELGDLIGFISNYDCCYYYEYNIYQIDEDGNLINELDEDGIWIGETESGYIYKEYLFNEYTLFWNGDLDVCDECDEEDIDDYDIVIPSYFSESFGYNCSGDDYCNDNSFHPNCDIPLDTTMVLNGKSVSIEKMVIFESGGYFGYIHYYPLDNYLIFEGDDDLDISNYKIVDYQRKE